MANYSVTDQTTDSDSIEVVAAALETLIEAVDNTKTIRYCDIIPLPQQGKWKGVLIYDA